MKKRVFKVKKKDKRRKGINKKDKRVKVIIIRVIKEKLKGKS
jgi:hypothetical protein